MISKICSVDAAFHNEYEYIIFKIPTERNFYSNFKKHWRYSYFEEKGHFSTELKTLRIFYISISKKNSKTYNLTQLDELYLMVYKRKEEKCCFNFALFAPYIQIKIYNISSTILLNKICVNKKLRYFLICSMKFVIS